MMSQTRKMTLTKLLTLRKNNANSTGATTKLLTLGKNNAKSWSVMWLEVLTSLMTRTQNGRQEASKEQETGGPLAGGESGDEVQITVDSNDETEKVPESSGEQLSEY